MAKALLLNALHEALSDYVAGLSPERLKVGVWSGKIVLDELQVPYHMYSFIVFCVLYVSYVSKKMVGLFLSARD